MRAAATLSSARWQSNLRTAPDREAAATHGRDAHLWMRSWLKRTQNSGYFCKYTNTTRATQSASRLSALRHVKKVDSCTPGGWGPVRSRRRGPNALRPTSKPRLPGKLGLRCKSFSSFRCCKRCDPVRSCAVTYRQHLAVPIWAARAQTFWLWEKNRPLRPRRTPPVSGLEPEV